MKTCKHCGKAFDRNPKESAKQWERREFCTRGCATRWRAKHQPRPVTAGACADCGKDADRLVKARCLSCYGKRRFREKREQILAQNRTWREANPDYYKQERIRRAAVRRAHARYFGSEELRAMALDRDGHRCTECGGAEALGIHHIDGDKANNALDNFQTLCNSCHAKEHYGRGDLAISNRPKRQAPVPAAPDVLSAPE